jgi:aminoglycoside phosphotransferase (APT) family kinase protein
MPFSSEYSIFMSEPFKPDINLNLVSQLISEQFPQWSDLPIKPVQFGGWDNRTFHLGEQMTVRLPSAECYSLQVEKEQRWLPVLARVLPLPISIPLAMGQPSKIYPWKWSVYKWLEGETANKENISNVLEFAGDLARFLKALYGIDAIGGPPAGAHNFYRGSSLKVYEPEFQQAKSVLQNSIDTELVSEIWEESIHSQWQGSPVWVHGDVSPGNLLVSGGRLSGVIDFGCSGVGDPACDLAIAWTFFDAVGREVFRKTLALDEATWVRGKGWALWKALFVLARLPGADPKQIASSQHTLDEILKDSKVLKITFEPIGEIN